VPLHASVGGRSPALIRLRLQGGVRFQHRAPPPYSTFRCSAVSSPRLGRLLRLPVGDDAERTWTVYCFASHSHRAGRPTHRASRRVSAMTRSILPGTRPVVIRKVLMHRTFGRRSYRPTLARAYRLHSRGRQWSAFPFPRRAMGVRTAGLHGALTRPPGAVARHPAGPQAR
jgi:hypothetical protein